MPPLRSTIGRVSQSALAWSFLATAIRGLAGLLILPLVARSLPSAHLGLWYVFVSLQGIISLFDLGFNPAVTRSAGYLWAGAKRLTRTGLEPLPVEGEDTTANLPLLNELIATMRAYYRFFGIAAGLIMLFGGGYWILEKTRALPDATSLRTSYLVFTIAIVLNATGDLWPALLAGVNQVRQSEKILFGSILINYLVVAAGILLHLGVWALVLGVLFSGLFLRTAGRISLIALLGRDYDRTRGPSWDLIKTLWPMAWRTGAVSLGTFLVLSANTLICSGYLGLKTTARYGLTLNLISILTYVSTIITQIKVPLANQLRVKGALPKIIEMWIDRTRLSLFAFAGGAIVLVLWGNRFLEAFGARTTLLPRGQLTVLLVILGLIMHHTLYAFLVVSENQNPFVVPALLSGIATVVLALFLTPLFGIWGILLAQGVVQVSFSNWWTVYRGIRGLGISSREYWSRYFRQPIKI